MTESPPGGRENRPPDEDGVRPELLTFDDGPAGPRTWLKERSLLTLTLGAMVLGIAVVGGVFVWSQDSFGTASDGTASERPAASSSGSPAATPPTSRSGMQDSPPALEGAASDVDAADRTAAPVRLAKVDGDGQVAGAGRVLDRLVVRVTDAAGDPVPGVEVLFRSDAEDDLVTPSRARTDALGRASAWWRLGAGVGVRRLSAEVSETDPAGAGVAPVTFTATALGDAAPTDVQAPPEPDPDAVPPSAGADTVPAPGAAGDSLADPDPLPDPDSLPGSDSLPEPEPEPVDVVRSTFDVGGTLVCSVASGRASCRGANDRGQLGGGGGAGFRGLAVGVSHACALDASGAAWCWGANDGGQLGDGSRTDRAVPVPVDTDLRFSILAAGSGHTCGLASGGRVACWGRNPSGQLGDGTRDDHSTPTLQPGGRSFLNLVAGWEHTCGLGPGGELACWGSNAQGQLGDGSRVDRLAPTRVPGSFGPVTAGSRHTCGIRGERLLCWGDNTFGQLGDGTTEARPAPTPVTGLPTPPVSLAAGAVHTCALLEDGAAWCWGQNVHGQLGDGTNQNRSEPSRVAGDLAFTSLYAGGALTCGFTGDGSQYCWGLNQTGQLGDGTRENRASPTRVGG